MGHLLAEGQLYELETVVSAWNWPSASKAYMHHNPMVPPWVTMGWYDNDLQSYWSDDRYTCL